MPQSSLPPDFSVDDVQVRILESYRNPSVRRIEQVVLRPGPRTYKIATLMEIVDTNTGESHHYSLKIDTIDKRKSGWFPKPDKSLRLEGDDPNEVERLFRFLQAHIEGKLSESLGEVRIIRSEQYEQLKPLLDQLPSLSSPHVVELLKRTIPRIENSATYLQEFVEAFESSDHETVKHIALASRVVEHRREYERLVGLVADEGSDEQAFQELLKQNPWMFGSEYSELLDRRKWTRDDNLDFMLRRTTDNFLEVVEIKTAFKESLMLHDRSHNSYYPSSKLSSVLGQVIRYIAELERNRDSILSKDDHDTLKVRARVIIGRDGTPAQQEALRNLNAHLHRIEVITFDQLIRIAARVLNVFKHPIE